MACAIPLPGPWLSGARAVWHCRARYCPSASGPAQITWEIRTGNRTGHPGDSVDVRHNCYHIILSDSIMGTIAYATNSRIQCFARSLSFHKCHKWRHVIVLRYLTTSITAVMLETYASTERSIWACSEKRETHEHICTYNMKITSIYEHKCKEGKSPIIIWILS